MAISAKRIFKYYQASSRLYKQKNFGWAVNIAQAYQSAINTLLTDIYKVTIKKGEFIRLSQWARVLYFVLPKKIRSPN